MLDSLIPVLIGFLFIGLILGGAYAWAMHWRKTVGPQLWAQFLERTGYRLLDAPDLPLLEQGRRVMQGFGIGGATRGPWVRHMGPTWIVYRSKTTTENDLVFSLDQWQTKLPGRAKVEFQLVDRTVAAPSTVDRVGNALMEIPRTFQQRYQAVTIPDPIFGNRFALYSPAPEQALALFGGDAELRAALLNLPGVHILVEGEDVVWKDDRGKLRAQFVGNAVHPSRLLELEPPMHDAVAWVVARIAQRCA